MTRRLALLVALAGCAPAEAPPAGPPAAEVPPAPPAAAEAASLYALEVPMVDQSGAAVALDAGRGHPTLVSMFYTSCPMACPLLVEQVRGLLAEAGPAADDARVLLISMDPEHDDVAALAESFRTQGLDARWTLAVPRAEQVREVAALLDIKLRPLPGGGFAHTSVVVLLDARGRPVGRAEGDEGRAALLDTLRRPAAP